MIQKVNVQTYQKHLVVRSCLPVTSCRRFKHETDGKTRVFVSPWVCKSLCLL